jgi:uncharacterized protein with PIN domain
MLGKLARWLRMLGHDVIYPVTFSDSELLDLAKREERVLLTRDLELYKRAVAKNLDALYVEGEEEPVRLSEIAKRYNLRLTIDMDKSHCPLCNTKLQIAQKDQLQSELEKSTFLYYDKFWRCRYCGQIYWQGAHWKQIQQTLNKAQQRLAH